MFELHITPKPEFLDAFIDIAKRLKLKLISHNNLTINGGFLYNETMIAEKCKDVSELNYKLDLLFRTAKQHNFLRVKVESMINDDFSFYTPYKMGSNYYEFHIDVEVSKISKHLNYVCFDNNLVISKNPKKDTYMLTYRCENKETYKHVLSKTLKDLEFEKILYTRVLKEYCFLDDNLEVDSPWLDTYNLRKETK